MKTLIIILVLAALIAFIVLQQSEINRKCESRKRYSDLWDFYHEIGTCKITAERKQYISDRLKSEKNLQKDEKALHIVEMCEQVFNARFR
jgi:hypothetical protein